MNCPKCDAEIGNASYCGCGWKRSRVQRFEETTPRVTCGFEPCEYLAKVRIKTARGWLNVCVGHYEKYYFAQAQDACAKLGLTTVDERRAYVRGAMKNLVKKWTPDYNAREPGEDEEYKHVAECPL